MREEFFYDSVRPLNIGGFSHKYFDSILFLFYPAQFTIELVINYSSFGGWGVLGLPPR